MVSPLAPEMHRESFASGRFAKLPNQEERARIGGRNPKSGPSRQRSGRVKRSPTLNRQTVDALSWNGLLVLLQARASGEAIRAN
jgi:hypothetical protein